MKKTSIIKKINDTLSEAWANRLQHTYLHLKKGIIPTPINTKKPRTFNEKIIWLKLNYRHPKGHIYADKIKVKELVLKNIGKSVLPKTLGIWESADAIDFNALPNRLVFKANHASGLIHLTNDLSNENLKALKIKLNSWLSVDYGKDGGEYQYSLIEPLLLAEEFLGDMGKPPLDYKFFCFHGDPLFIQVDIDRFGIHKRAFFDLDWNPLDFTISYAKYCSPLPSPPHLKKMIEIARELAKESSFIRVDLYDLPDGPKFGELTLHPNGGFEPFVPKKWDYIVGNFLKLPISNINDCQK